MRKHIILTLIAMALLAGCGEKLIIIMIKQKYSQVNTRLHNCMWQSWN